MRIKKIAIGIAVTIVGTLMATYIYDYYKFPNPKLEYYIRSNDIDKFTFAIKNIGDVGVKNLSVTYREKIYMFSKDFEGFIGTGFDRKSKFNQPGENWISNESIPPKGLPFEKEFSPPVEGDEYVAVEIMDVYYQRENDLKQYPPIRKIFLSQNNKIYKENEARSIPKFSKILDKLPSVIDSPSLYMEMQGVKKLN